MMKSSLKKFLKVNALVLCLVMLFSVIPFATFAVNPTTSEQYTVTVAGGTAAFANKAEAFTGTVTDGDVVTVTYTEVAGRTFKWWKTDTGTIIKDKSFSFIASCDSYFYVVYTDSDAYPYSEPVPVSPEDYSCEHPTTLVSENTVGDVMYVFPEGWGHNIGDAEYTSVNGTYHSAICPDCGEEVLSAHWLSQIESSAPTHGEYGKETYICLACGYEYTISSPKLDEPHEMGAYHIFQESANGEYGIRMQKCEYCDYTETCWYLTPDFKTLMKNHYLHFTSTSRNFGKSKDEWFYSFTEEDGTVAYFYLVQYAQGGTNDRNSSYLFRFYDDENPDTLKPVYVHATPNNAYNLDSVYGYVKTFDEWIAFLDCPSDTVGYDGDRTISNLMDFYSSNFVGFGYAWANAVNSSKIPITEDPDEYMVSANSVWTSDDSTVIGQLNFYDEATDSLVYFGGIDTKTYKRSLSSYGDAEIFNVDPETGVVVHQYDSVSGGGTTYYITAYEEIVSNEAYDAMDLSQKKTVLPVRTIPSYIHNSTFNRSTIDINVGEPDSIKGFRIMCPVGYSHFSFSCSGYYDSSYYNPSRVIPASTEVTVSYYETSNDIFVRWDKWDFENEEWVPISYEKTFSFGGADNKTTEPICLACVTEPLTYHVSISDGARIYLNHDYSTYYNEVDVAPGTIIQIDYWTIPEGKEHSHWLVNGSELYYSNASLTINEDTEIGEVLTDLNGGASFGIYTTGEISVNGGAYTSNESINGAYGSVFTITTRPSEEYPEFNEFLGWYVVTYGKDGEKFELLSTETTLEYTILGWPNGPIYAVWSDGNVSFDPEMIDVTVVGGFAAVDGRKGRDSKTYILSSFSANSYERLSIYDDPSDSLNTKGCTVEYTLDDGTPVSEDVYREFYRDIPQDINVIVNLPGLDSISDGSVTITVITHEPCADDLHRWSLPETIRWPSHTESGTEYKVCQDCGEIGFETLPAQSEDHYFSDYTKEYLDEEYHASFCECGEIMKEEHSWDTGREIPEFNVIRFTCSVCHATLDIKTGDSQLDIKDTSEVVIEVIDEVPVLRGVEGLTTAEELKEMFTNVSTVVVDKEGNEIADDALVGTGARILLVDSEGNVVDEAVVIVSGDTNGDGKVSSVDALIALKESAGLSSLDIEYVLAGDLSDTGMISSIDALNILRISSGLEPIVP